MLNHRTVDVTRTPAVTLHISSHRPSDSAETALKVSMTAPRERNTAQGESTGVDAACTVTEPRLRHDSSVMSGRERTNQTAIFF